MESVTQGKGRICMLVDEDLAVFMNIYSELKPFKKSRRDKLSIYACKSLWFVHFSPDISHFPVFHPHFYDNPPKHHIPMALPPSA
jgi:hypothetical protein